MGPQPPLPLPHKNRCSILDPLPFAIVSPPSRASPLLLPHRDLPHHSAFSLTLPILDLNKWKPKGHCSLGNPAESLPPGSRRGLHCPVAVHKSQRPVSNTGNPETDKHWWHCRGARWKVRGHPNGGCVDKLCEGARGSIHLALYVLLVQAFEHGTPE